MQLPEGAARPKRADNTLVKALARAYRWKRMLETGEVATIADLAMRENIAASYLTRILRLTFLSPDIVEEILDGRQALSMTAEALRADFDDDWNCQRHSLEKTR
jgi:hypothetical protein